MTPSARRNPHNSRFGTARQSFSSARRDTTRVSIFGQSAVSWSNSFCGASFCTGVTSSSRSGGPFRSLGRQRTRRGQCVLCVGFLPAVLSLSRASTPCGHAVVWRHSPLPLRARAMMSRHRGCLPRLTRSSPSVPSHPSPPAPPRHLLLSRRHDDTEPDGLRQLLRHRDCGGSAMPARGRCGRRRPVPLRRHGGDSGVFADARLLSRARARSPAVLAGE